MKKIGAFLVIFLFLITIALAQTPSSDSEDNYYKAPSSPTVSNRITTDDKDKTPINDKINQNLDKERPVPEALVPILKIFFKVEEKVSFSLFIIILMLWLFSWILFANLLRLFPPLNNWTAWVLGIAVTILIGLSGTIRSFALFLLNAGNGLEILEKLPAGTLSLIIIALIVAGYFANKILSVLSKKIELETAKDEGSKLGVTLGFMTKFKEMFGFTQKISHTPN